MSAQVDPAIRSIRIAATLNERFAVLTRARLLPGSNVSDLELRIGEAQQIYPEIWGHLDEARTVLAGRGVPTTTYETIRALEPKGSIGVTRVEVEGVSTTYTMQAFGIQDGTIKTAQFNLEGHRRATMAVKALMDALPEVDWKALERAENAEIAAAGSLGPINGRSALKLLLIGGGALLIVYLTWFFLVREKPHDQVAERKRHIADLRARLDAAPCDGNTVEYLTNEEGWDEPKVTDHGPTIEHYKQLCEAQVTALEHDLDATPCDAAGRDQLIKLLTQSGRAYQGHKAAGEYKARCTGVGGPPSFDRPDPGKARP